MKKKCRVYKPQSMQAGGQTYDQVAAQALLQQQARMKMFTDAEVDDVSMDSTALYKNASGNLVPVKTQTPYAANQTVINQRRVSPTFIDPTSTSYQAGGESNDTISFTQDSQMDPVPQEKNNAFLKWLNQTNQEKRLDMELAEQVSMESRRAGEYFMQQQKGIEAFQYGGNYVDSGAQSGDYFEKTDTNAQYFQDSLEASNPNFGKNLQVFGKGMAEVFKAKPPQPTYESMNGEVYNPEAMSSKPTEGFGIKPGGFNAPTKGFQLNTPPLFKAQNGIDYPGYNLELLPEIDTETTGNIMGRNAESAYNSMMAGRKAESDYDTMMAQKPKESQYTTFQDSQKTQDLYPEDMSNEDKGKGRFGSIGMDPRNTNIAQGVIAGLRVGEGLFGMGDRMKAEQELNNRFSNVFETYGTQGQDRGDYMANAPGVGDPLKPDQHTRMGYNTKMAQDGLQVDNELELTDEQISELIAQGYNLEYLD